MEPKKGKVMEEERSPLAYKLEAKEVGKRDDVDLTKRMM